MITIRKYSPEDWLKIDDAAEPFFQIEQLDEFTKRGLALTALDDSVVMACGGVVCVNDDEGIVWVKVSSKCRQQAYRWARTIREVFCIIMKSLGHMTIITYVLDKFRKGEKLARSIGMSKSGEVYEFNGNIYNKYMVIT